MENYNFNIQEELKKLPGRPGVYLMHDETDQIIYVGKAISLKNRVRQYFQSSRNKGVKIEQMVTHIRRFEYIVTDSELEALVLECNLIKEHRPKYNTMLMDDKAYVSDEEFAQVIARFDGRTEERVLANYDMVLHLITCAKGAEFAYDLANNARTESIEFAREMDDRTLRAWSAHPNLRIIDNDANFNNKIERALREIYRAVGEVEPMAQKRKYLIAMPDMAAFSHKYRAAAIDMTQTYLALTNPNIERRVRMQKSGAETLYFYTEKHRMENGEKWDTERPISQKQYEKYLLERDTALSPVRKTKYRFVFADRRCEIDVYPFSAEKAVLFQYGQNSAALPEEITVLREVTGDADYKNRKLAALQKL